MHLRSLNVNNLSLSSAASPFSSVAMETGLMEMATQILKDKVYKCLGAQDEGFLSFVRTSFDQGVNNIQNCFKRHSNKTLDKVCDTSI